MVDFVTRTVAKAFIDDHPRPDDYTDRNTRFAVIKMLLRGLVIYDPKTKKIIVIDPLLRAMK